MGPPAAAGFDAEDPAVAYNARRNEYLVVWRGDDSPGPLVNDEFEIFAQRLTAAGAEVGANDRRISDMGPNGDTTYSAEDPAVVYNPTSDEYLVAWEGDDNPGPLVEGEDEVFVQRLDARGAPVGRQRPAGLRHGPRRRHGLLGREARPWRTTRRATSTWWPGRGTTTPAHSWTTSPRSTPSGSPPTAPRWG